MCKLSSRNTSETSLPREWKIKYIFELESICDTFSPNSRQTGLYRFDGSIWANLLAWQNRDRHSVSQAQTTGYALHNFVKSSDHSFIWEDSGIQKNRPEYHPQYVGAINFE